MPEISDDTQPATSYPTQQQYDRWKQRASDRDMSLSEFMAAMIEAGIKADRGFEFEETQGTSVTEIRQQRNELKSELDHARQRISELEEQLYRSERRTVQEFVEANQGVTYAEITQHLIDTVPSRMVQHLEELEGAKIIAEDGEYYAIDQSDRDRSEEK